MLILAKDEKLLLMDVEKPRVYTYIQMSNNRQIVDLDYDPVEKRVYWVDYQGSVYRIYLDGSGKMGLIALT